MATLRLTGRSHASLETTTARVGSGSIVLTFGSTTPWRWLAQFSTTDTSPAAPRLCPSAPLWE
jgi:hypothetical protein